VNTTCFTRGWRRKAWPSATYISVLVRAHLRDLAPLSKDELVVLKQAVTESGAIDRNLKRIARAVHLGLTQIPTTGLPDWI
jgi:hypothetical protein